MSTIFPIYPVWPAVDFDASKEVFEYGFGVIANWKVISFSFFAVRTSPPSQPTKNFKNVSWEMFKLEIKQFCNYQQKIKTEATRRNTQ